MRVKSRSSKTIYYFDFSVEQVQDISDKLSSKEAAIRASVLSDAKELLWSGYVRVKWNAVGVYPKPADLKQVELPKSIVQLLSVELKRYLKPQKDFL